MKSGLLTPAFVLLLISNHMAAQGLNKANGRNDADIYASATLVGAASATTIYAFDLKFAYRQKYWPINDNWVFRARPLFEFVTNKGTRTSPDRVNLGGEAAFARSFTRPLRARGLRKAQPTEVSLVANPRGEFDRKFDTRNFVGGTFTRIVFPILPGPNPARVNLAPVLELGTENGTNFSNRLQPAGSGAIARIYGGFSGIVWHRRLEPRSPFLQLGYQYRGPLRPEIYTELADSPGIRYLSGKPRHYVEAGLTIPINNYVAVKPQYKWGSLPPAFSYLDHQYTLNLEVSAKR